MSLKMQGQIAKLDVEMNSTEGLTEKRLHEVTLIEQLEQELSRHGQ